MDKEQAANGLLITTAVFGAFYFDGTSRVLCTAAAAIAATAGVIHEIRTRRA